MPGMDWLAGLEENTWVEHGKLGRAATQLAACTAGIWGNFLLPSIGFAQLQLQDCDASLCAVLCLVAVPCCAVLCCAGLVWAGSSDGNNPGGDLNRQNRR